MPFEHHIGWLSAEFGGALPSQIEAEQQRVPVGLLEQIVEYRYAAAAYLANKNDPAGWQSSPMRTLMKEIEHELVAVEIEAKQNG